jgi:hypothetical protein
MTDKQTIAVMAAILFSSSRPTEELAYVDGNLEDELETAKTRGSAALWKAGELFADLVDSWSFDKNDGFI